MRGRLISTRSIRIEIISYRLLMSTPTLQLFWSHLVGQYSSISWSIAFEFRNSIAQKLHCAGVTASPCSRKY